MTVVASECIDAEDCVGDVNGDGFVNVQDLLQVIADWACDGDCEADLNGDLTVDVSDLLLVIASWGSCDGG